PCRRRETAAVRQAAAGCGPSDARSFRNRLPRCDPRRSCAWSRPSRPLECDHRTPPVAGFLLKRKETAIPTPRLPYRAGCDLVTRRALLYTGRPTTSRTKDGGNEEGHPSRLPYDHGGHDGRNDVPDPFDLRFRGRNAHSR